MSKQALRNLLRWGGLVVAAIGFIMGRSAQTASAYHASRIVVWIGWTTGVIQGGDSGNLAVSDLMLDPGKYAATIMVLNGDPVNGQQLDILSSKLSLDQTLSVSANPQSENSQ